MSIELDVKIRRRITYSDFLTALDTTFDNYITLPGRVPWSVQYSTTGNEIIGSGGATIDLRAADSAFVQCTFYSAGPEVELGEDGGTWAAISCASRTAESFVLMFLAAMVLAHEGDSSAVDESSLTSANKVLSASEMKTLIEGVSKGKFATVAGDFANRLGRPI